MNDQTLLSSGINDEEDVSTITDNDEDQEISDTDPSEDGDEPWKKGKESVDIDYKKKFYATTNLQNLEIKKLKDEIAMLKNSWTSKEDLDKIKERYDEDDLEILEKIIDKKASKIINDDRQKNLVERELNIFLKKNPEISEPELRHVQDLQKNYWYSLQKAYEKINGITPSQERKPWTWVGSSLNGWSWLAIDKSKGNDDKAYQDLLKNYIP